MPQIKPEPTRRPTLLIIVVVAAVVVTAVSGYVLWRLFPTATQTVAQVDQLYAKRDFYQAYTKLKSAYARALTNNDKALILSRLAAITATQNRLDESLGYYQELLKLAPDDYSTLVSAAQLAERLKRKDQAITWYKHALEIEKRREKGLFTESEINRLTATIDRLEKQP